MDDNWRLISITSKNRIFHSIRFIFYFFILSTLVSLVTIFIILTPIVSNITKPVSKLTKAVEQVSKGDLNTCVEIRSRDELETLGEGFNKMICDLRNYINESVESEKIKRKLQIDLLISQINPHFIYNTLNSVIFMAQLQGNHDIVKMTKAFIAILQDTVKVGKEGLFVTVRQEMENVNYYVQIQEYRYPEQFKLSWNVDEQILDRMIPRTMLQPLVENALFHGILPKEEKGEILINIARDKEDLKIIVEDDGIGMDELTTQKLLSGQTAYDPASRMRPIGMDNIRDRIRYLYGPGYDLCIESKMNQGTKVIIKIPMKD